MELTVDGNYFYEQEHFNQTEGGESHGYAHATQRMKREVADTIGSMIDQAM